MYRSKIPQHSWSLVCRVHVPHRVVVCCGHEIGIVGDAPGFSARSTPVAVIRDGVDAQQSFVDATETWMVRGDASGNTVAGVEECVLVDVVVGGIVCAAARRYRSPGPRRFGGDQLGGDGRSNLYSRSIGGHNRVCWKMCQSRCISNYPSMLFGSLINRSNHEAEITPTDDVWHVRPTLTAGSSMILGSPSSSAECARLV